MSPQGINKNIIGGSEVPNSSSNELIFGISQFTIIWEISCTNQQIRLGIYPWKPAFLAQLIWVSNFISCMCNSNSKYLLLSVLYPPEDWIACSHFFQAICLLHMLLFFPLPHTIGGLSRLRIGVSASFTHWILSCGRYKNVPTADGLRQKRQGCGNKRYFWCVGTLADFFYAYFYLFIFFFVTSTVLWDAKKIAHLVLRSKIVNNRDVLVNGVCSVEFVRKIMWP